jgi:hypothetical protein
MVVTMKPTAGATTEPCNMPALQRSLELRVEAEKISSAIDLDTAGSPQYEALNWITNLDAAYICPADPDFAQRYTMAVFYYSTGGSRWLQCGAPSEFTPSAIEAANQACSIAAVEGGGTDAWLTPSSECEWGGVACSNGIVERIDFGT